jgi:hypothetical protein
MYLFRPIRQIFPLANRSTDWQSGRPFGIQVNLLANGKIWCMGQPTGKVVNWCTKFTMLFPSTKLLVYTPSEPLNLFFLLPLHMPSPCHSCCILSLNCCIGSLSRLSPLALSLTADPARSGPGIQFTNVICKWR